MKTINKLILTGLIISSVAYSSTSKKDIQEAFEQLKFNIDNLNLDGVQKNLDSIKKLSKSTPPKQSFMFFVTSDGTLWSNFLLVKRLKQAERKYIQTLRTLENAYRLNQTNFIENTLKPDLKKANTIRNIVAEVTQEMTLTGPSNKAEEELQQQK